MPNNGVAIVGTGNMADNLIRTFNLYNIPISGVWGRSNEKLDDFQKKYNVKVSLDFSQIESGSIVILCVADRVIHEVAKKVPSGCIVAHTSGSIPMDVIEQEQKGVFYPLQTVTKGKEVDFKQVPILIEGATSSVLNELKALASQITTRVEEIDSEKRAKIHLAAVMLNNFVTQLVKMSGDYLDHFNLDRSLLHPLLEETVAKIQDIGAKKALTGPAKRGDKEIIQKHLQELKGELAEVYAIMSKVIQKENGKL